MSFTPGRLRRALEECLAQARDPGVSGYCVALSGGLDSTALLSALARLRDAGVLSLPLRAVHVDHGLHADSRIWSEACIALTAAESVPLTRVEVDARPAPGESPEAAAREARYSAIRAGLAAGEVLLTAHHADDQLETILLQWLRGGGLRAVAGMQSCVRFGPGWLARPLLEVSRDDLRAWADHQCLRWMNDPSNLDPRFDRNYLRLEVLPALRARWPAAARTAARVAQYAADALELERSVAGADLLDVSEGVTVSLSRLAPLAPARQRAALRAWLTALGLPRPSARTLEALRHDMTTAAPDRIPVVDWPGAVVRRYRGRIYGEPPRDPRFIEGTWQIGDAREWSLGSGCALELVAATGRGLSRDRLPAEVQVVARMDGAEFREAGAAAHSRPLRKWFQEHGVLPWRRDALPLLCVGGRIVAIADISCAEEFAARPDEPSWCVHWRGRPPLTEQQVLAFNWPEHPEID